LSKQTGDYVTFKFQPLPRRHLPEIADDPPDIFAGAASLFVNNIPDVVPTPGLWVRGGCPTQPFHIEVWVEKSTVNDILEPLAEHYGLNIQPGVGEISMTRCRELIERADPRPIRILYVSDFDPGGQSMPVAAAVKIGWRNEMLESGLDIQLHPVVLTHEQCVEYRLPRTPIKETEKRGVRFEERFGEGATELDALEALRPGELRRILVSEIERFHDPHFAAEWGETRQEAETHLDEIAERVLARHVNKITSSRA
jgi:hypothetical protein